MKDALIAGDISAVDAELNQEQRVLGWGNRPGIHGAAAHTKFHELHGAVRRLRLQGRPDAW